MLDAGGLALEAASTACTTSVCGPSRALVRFGANGDRQRTAGAPSREQRAVAPASSVKAHTGWAFMLTAGGVLVNTGMAGTVRSRVKLRSVGSLTFPAPSVARTRNV